MKRRMIWCLLLAGVTTACQPRRPTDAREGGLPTTAPNADVVEFASPEKGVRLSYPADWRAVDAPEEGFILWLAPSNARDERTAPAVSLEVPKLPPHIPGFIPLGSVVRGYVDDLKKQRPEVTVNEPVEMKVDGANARRVRAAWYEPDGTPRVEDAVLTVHGDRVYIFRGTQRAGEENLEIARPVLEQVVNSVQWE